MCQSQTQKPNQFQGVMLFGTLILMLSTESNFLVQMNEYISNWIQQIL